MAVTSEQQGPIRRASGSLVGLVAAARERTRRPSPLPPTPPHPVAARSQEIEFFGFADDCEVRGYIRLGSERLTDHLNANTQVHLSDVLVVALRDEHGQVLSEIDVRVEELIAVGGGGPRGDPQRRRGTRPWPIAIHSGPFRIRGYLHAPPTVDALGNLQRRSAMVPLTDASIEYDVGAERRRSTFATLIVNRERIERVERAVDEDIEFPALPPSPVKGALVKDFTELVIGNQGRP